MHVIVDKVLAPSATKKQSNRTLRVLTTLCTAVSVHLNLAMTCSLHVVMLSWDRQVCTLRFTSNTKDVEVHLYAENVFNRGSLKSRDVHWGRLKVISSMHKVWL